MGCAGVAPTYTTHNGLAVYNKSSIDLPQQDVENFISNVVNTFGFNVSGIKVYFYSKLIQVPVENNKVIIADGISYRNKKLIIVSIFSKCLAASSLTHELAHMNKGSFHNKNLENKISDFERKLKAKCDPKDIELDKVSRAKPNE